MAKIIFATALLLALSLVVFSPPTSLAAPDEVKWSRVNIPTKGSAGNRVLADGSDVQHLTMAIDGTLYGYATPSGLRSHNNAFRVNGAGGFYSLTIKPYLDT
jgi:hypothetical protein